jgi:hypothetical protein
VFSTSDPTSFPVNTNVPSLIQPDNTPRSPVVTAQVAPWMYGSQQMHPKYNVPKNNQKEVLPLADSPEYGRVQRAVENKNKFESRERITKLRQNQEKNHAERSYRVPHNPMFHPMFEAYRPNINGFDQLLKLKLPLNYRRQF